MAGSADTNLVLALLNREDALHARAQRHLAGKPRLRIGWSVAAELFLLLHRRGFPYKAFLDQVDEHFDLEHKDVLYLAAHTLDERLLRTPLDALHAAEAFLRHDTLHTADGELLASSFPTAAF